MWDLDFSNAYDNLNVSLLKNQGDCLIKAIRLVRRSLPIRSCSYAGCAQNPFLTFQCLEIVSRWICCITFPLVSGIILCIYVLSLFQKNVPYIRATLFCGETPLLFAFLACHCWSAFLKVLLSIPMLFRDASEIKALKLPMDISFTLFVSHSVCVHVQVLEMGPSHAAFSEKVRVFAVIPLGCFPLPCPLPGTMEWGGRWLWNAIWSIVFFILKMATENHSQSI